MATGHDILLIAAAAGRGGGGAVRPLDQGAVVETVIWVMALIAAVAVAGLGLMIAYYKLLKPNDPATPSPAGLVADLRAARDRGEISEAEFQRTKHVMALRAAGKPLGEARRLAAEKFGEPEPGESAAAALVARPGFDLTGEPLPTPGEGDSGTGGG